MEYEKDFRVYEFPNDSAIEGVEYQEDFDSL